MDIVLDASVAVKWFNEKNEDYVKTAVEIQDRKISGYLDITVPDLFFLEVLNAFLTKSGFGPQEISTIQQVLHKLDLRIIYPDNNILEDTVQIACTNNLTIYDSLYIAIAKVCEAPLYTEDKKILSCRSRFTFIKHLKEFDEYYPVV